jgi:alkylated DNA repair dioxygenase AlkB
VTTPPQRLSLPGATLLYWPAAIDPCSADNAYNTLKTELDWRQPVVNLFGKTTPSPRLTAWCSAPGVSYTYSGVTHSASAWHPTVAALRNRIERMTDSQFNSCLINYYRDGDDAMGWHSDDEAELGEQPVIASLSVGTTRTFHLKPKSKDKGVRYSLPLESGSLLVMAGNTQANYKHAIHRSRRVHRGRINLTFRRIERV